MAKIVPLSETATVHNYRIRTLHRLGVPVTRENYLALIDPDTDPDAFPPDIEDYLPPFLRKK